MFNLNFTAMAIEWTPWFNVPMHCRLEVLSLIFFMFCAMGIPLISAFTFIYLLFWGSVYSKVICMTYVTFICYDWRTGDCGGRGIGVVWLRGLGVWKHFLNYFPVDLVKTVDLPADRNYLVCIFPHGLISIGAAINFATSHSKWSRFFPRIRPKLTTLMANTLFPISRELLFSHGFSSASVNSLRTLLNQTNDPFDEINCDGYTSNAVGLIVGGSREAQCNFPNTYKCVVEKRRGFVRVALETGASLVPAISFGENNIYKTINVKSEFWQRTIKRMGFQRVNVVPGVRNGCGLFQYNFGPLPIRHPIITVIGAPIHLKKTTNPTVELLDKNHKLFCTHLIELFETHKSKYVENFENVYLEIV